MIIDLFSQCRGDNLNLSHSFSLSGASRTVRVLAVVLFHSLRDFGHSLDLYSPSFNDLSASNRTQKDAFLTILASSRNLSL